MKFEAAEFEQNLLVQLRHKFGKDVSQASSRDIFEAVSTCVMSVCVIRYAHISKKFGGNDEEVLIIHLSFPGTRHNGIC